jgi:hypothetical protein
MIQNIIIFCAGALFGLYYPELVEEGILFAQEFLNKVMV